jgi:GNAT superfamily N-acetyltransferase
MVEVSELDVADEATLREFYDVEVAAHAAERPHAVLRTFPQLLQMAQRPSSYYRRVLLAAREAGRIVGTADLGLSLQDNPHLAQLEVRVLPGARRRGVGTMLHAEVLRLGRAAGRTTYLGEAFEPRSREPSPSLLFARAVGYDEVHREDHQLLDLPLPAGLLDSLPHGAPGYEIVTWRDRAPDDLVESYAAMLTQMARDVPSGDIDHEPVTIDVARVREGEERTARAYLDVVAAARRTADGVLGGYTLVHLAHDADYVVQDDTLVMPEHRGHGLGLALKATVLRLLAAEHAERRVIHTWNAVDNAPMQRINRVLGFRPVEWEVEMQLKVVDA